MIDLRLLTLIAVAEERNFTKAAEKLNLTQPAVSHHIKDLENELNTQLFIRKKGDTVLTPGGEIVLNYAKRFLAMYDKLKQELHESRKKINLKIGITHTAESNKTTEVIGNFLKNHSDVSMTIISGSTADLFQKIENYEVDFAIVDQKRGGNVNYLPLDTDSLVCVINPESPLTRNDAITVEELKQEKLILRLPTSSTRILFDSALKSINESINNFNVVLELDNVATIKELIRRNVGVSILSKSTCRYEVSNKKLAILPIKNLSLQRNIYLIYSDHFQHIGILNELKEIYSDTISEEY